VFKVLYCGDYVLLDTIRFRKGNPGAFHGVVACSYVCNGLL